MGSINLLLDIGKKGILAHQTSISVAGHNIANVDTEGYSRQEAVLGSTVAGGLEGTGVTVETIRRNYDNFIETQLASESSEYGKLSSKDSSIQKVEMLFGETTGLGLNHDIDNFFDAMNDLSNNPEGVSERNLLKSRGEILSNTFNSMSSNLTDMRKGLDVELEVLVDEVNVITSSIAELNANIASLERSGVVANDFRDQRTSLIRQLSEKIDINTYDAGDGSITIQSTGGYLLVQRNDSFDLSTRVNASNDGLLDVYVTTSGGTTTNITSSIGSGNIGGILEARDTDIPGYLNSIDELAYSIAVEVNTLHQTGYAVDGVTTGLDFFSDLTTLSSPPAGAAANIAVSSDVADVNNIAAAGSLNSPGDNTVALAMAALRNKTNVAGLPANVTFSDQYNATVTDVGIDLQSIESQLEQKENLLNQLDMKRESVSGVSIDEEMTNLVKFQYAFEASARLINIADEMLATVLGMVN